jgi:predicted dehydrogenase
VNAVWSDPEVQAVVICSETGRHKELVAAAAKAKKHMFVEKPLGITAAESREMAGAIEQAGLLFTTGYFMRTHPNHLFLKEQIDQGNLGKITRVRASNCHTGSLGGWFDEKPDQPAESWRWMADPKQAGVGAFGDLGTHKLDILMWLFGDVDEVSAHVDIVTNRYKDCDETGEALMRFKNGIIGTLAAGWVDVDDPVQLLISGTEGQVSGADGKKPFKDLPSAPQLPLHQFVNAVAGKKDQPLVKPSEAAARVEVMEAMYNAARSRKWVTV